MHFAIFRNIGYINEIRHTWAICNNNNSTRRAGKLYKARSRLYRSQILQVDTHVKALAGIYTMHSFAPFFNQRDPQDEEVEAAADRPRPGDRGRPGLPGLQVLAAKKGGEWETRHREACSGLRC